ncbi:MAG TPA: TlpA disulfide reductase family protein [Rhodocyclaceae bacterium]
MKPLLRGILIVAVAAGAGWLGFRQGQQNLPEAAPTAQAGPALARLMALSLPDSAGKPQRLEQWRGRPLVINFWATWCPPCKEEMPALSRAQEQFSAKGVQFVGISIDEATNVTQYLKNNKVAYPLLIATPDTLSLVADLGNATQGLPFTLILDRAGQIAAVKLGRIGEEELAQHLRRIAP